MTRTQDASDPLEMLQWDSDFFGFPIGRVVGSAPTSDLLAAAVDSARSEGLRCLYLFVDGSGAADLAPERLGFYFVDVQIDLARSTEPLEHTRHTPGVEVRAGTPSDVQALEPALLALAKWSRFAADPHFGPERALQMYHTWVAKAATSPDALFSVAVGEDGEPFALVTCEMRQEPWIGLLASAQPGAGAGNALVGAALDWARPRGNRLNVRTQARNVTALRFYERLGFRAQRAQYIYHLWLDEGER